jgi:hypothetical protein
MKLRRSLYARPEIVRGQQCAEARLHAERCCVAARRCGGDGRGGSVVTAEPSWMGERRRRGNPSGVGPAQPPVAVAVEDVRTPDTPLVACPRPLSAGRTSVHWVGRTSGVQRDRCPRDRRDPGVRTDTPPVTVAPASALSAPRWILACVGAAGPPTSGRVGCDISRWSASGWVVAAPNWGLAGKGWSWVRLCLAPTGSTADRPPVWIRGGCGVALAAGPTWELVERRVPVGWLGARAGAAAHTLPCRCVLDRLPV